LLFIHEFKTRYFNLQVWRRLAAAGVEAAGGCGRGGGWRLRLVAGGCGWSVGGCLPWPSGLSLSFNKNERGKREKAMRQHLQKERNERKSVTDRCSNISTESSIGRWQIHLWIRPPLCSWSWVTSLFFNFPFPWFCRTTPVEREGESVPSIERCMDASMTQEIVSQVLHTLLEKKKQKSLEFYQNNDTVWMYLLYIPFRLAVNPF
jgi:hypothetical protein